ncbi:AraC family ligand binding domain-containing protein [Azotobacter sp. CWF10]
MKVISLPRGRHQLHTMPTNAGYDRVQDCTYCWDGRRRGSTPFAIVQHTLAGEGNLRFEGRHYRLRDGDTMLVLVPHDHCYWLEAGEPGSSSGSPCTARRLSACNGPCWTSVVRCCALATRPSNAWPKTSMP